MRYRAAILFALSVSTARLAGAGDTINQLSVVEEIIVSAQKREQSSQEIGISITAFSGESLRRLGVDQASRLDAFTPNVSFSSDSGGGVPVVIVRGVGLANFRINDTPTTSLYIDEVYQPSIVSAEFSMFDLERVELLKGPQGGIYGRNTIAGAMQILARKPDVSDGTQGYLDARFGRFNQLELEGAAGAALSDSVAIRVAARSATSDERKYRSVISGNRTGEQDRQSARVMLNFEPNDNFNVLVKVHGGKDNSEVPPLRTLGLYVDSGNAAASGAPHVALGLLDGQYCASVLAGLGSDPATCASLDGRTPASIGLARAYDAATTKTDFLDNSWYGASVIADWSWNDYTLTSISAFDHVSYLRDVDYDAVASVHQESIYNSRFDNYSQELRISNGASERMSWILGTSYGRSDLKEHSQINGADGILPLFFPAPFGVQDYDQSAQALAIFGHSDWRLTQSLSLVSELRYTNEEVDFAGPGLVLHATDGTLIPLTSADEEESFNAFSGKLALELTPRDGLLLYASISQGFKSGGFYGGFATNPRQLEPFDAETNRAYETGFKSTLADNRVRLNGSVFYYDRQDVQANARSDHAEFPVARLQNVGDARTVGAELELSWAPNDAFSVDAGLGYLEAEYLSRAFSTTGILDLLDRRALKGLNVPDYSKFSANVVARWRAQVRELFSDVQLEYSYRSSRDLALIVHPFEEAPIAREPGHSLVNLRGRLYRNEVSGWEVGAYIDNVFDERVRSQMNLDGLGGLYEIYADPRIYGLSVSYRWR